MAKVIALIASAICFLAITSHALNEPRFTIEGMIYCDSCKVLFPTDISDHIAHADLQIQCRDPLTGAVTVTVDGQTNEGGYYSLSVDNDHENEICEVKVLNTPTPYCNVIAPEISTARVSLAKNSGISSMIRYANPIGFQTQKAAAGCQKVLDNLGFIPEPVLKKNNNKNKKNKRVSIRRGF